MRFEVACSDPTAHSLVTDAKLVGDLLDGEKPNLTGATRCHDLAPPIRRRAPNPRSDKCLEVLDAIGNAATREFDEKRSPADDTQTRQVTPRHPKPGRRLLRRQQGRTATKGYRA